MNGLLIKKLIPSLNALPVYVTGFFGSILMFMPFFYITNLLEIQNYKIIFILILLGIIGLAIKKLSIEDIKENICKKQIMIFPVVIFFSFIYNTIDSSNIFLHTDYFTYSKLIEMGSNFSGENLLNGGFISAKGFTEGNIIYSLLGGYQFIGSFSGLVSELDLINYLDANAIHNDAIANGLPIKIGFYPQFQLFILMISIPLITSFINAGVKLIKENYRYVIWGFVAVGITVGQNYTSGMIMPSFLGLYIFMIFILYIRKELSWSIILFLMLSLNFYMISIFMVIPFVMVLKLLEGDKPSWKVMVILILTQLFVLTNGVIIIQGKEVKKWIELAMFVLLVFSYIGYYIFFNIGQSIISWGYDLFFKINNAQILLGISIILWFVAERQLNYSSYQEFQKSLILTRIAYSVGLFVLIVVLTKKNLWKNAYSKWLFTASIFVNVPSRFVLSQFVTLNDIGHRFSAYVFNEEAFAIQSATPIMAILAGIVVLKLFKKNNLFIPNEVQKIR